jgi:hypothetical protein
MSAVSSKLDVTRTSRDVCSLPDAVAQLWFIRIKSNFSKHANLVTAHDEPISSFSGIQRVERQLTLLPLLDRRQAVEQVTVPLTLA